MKHTIRVSTSSHSDAITKLLEIMDVEDVQGTGVQLITADERSRSREVTQAEEALRSHHDRAFLEDCMVHCLKVYNVWLSVSTPTLIFYWRKERGRINSLSLLPKASFCSSSIACMHCQQTQILRDTLLTRSQRRRFPVCLLWAGELSDEATTMTLQ